MKNVLIVISGPSGVGKGTIAKMLVEKNSGLDLSISCTTREKRKGEIDGKHYFFVTRERFLQDIENDGFLEYSEHFGNFYGTPKEFVLNKLKTDDVLLEIDVNGGLNVKKSFKDAVLIMVIPPSIEELKKRLVNRSTETEEQIKTRMQRIEYEMDKRKEYDYVVVNDNLDCVVKEIEKIICLEKNR